MKWIKEILISLQDSKYWSTICLINDDNILIVMVIWKKQLSRKLMKNAQYAATSSELVKQDTQQAVTMCTISCVSSNMLFTA